MKPLSTSLWSSLSTPARREPIEQTLGSKPEISGVEKTYYYENSL
jgi:hypothetical protein